jgi:hypothetical protein
VAVAVAGGLVAVSSGGLVAVAGRSVAVGCPVAGAWVAVGDTALLQALSNRTANAARARYFDLFILFSFS